MAKRGFFAELNHQAQQAEKRRQQQEAKTVRAHNAAVREHERATKAAQRARAQAARASEAQRKAADKEAARLHVEARTAEVEALNTGLAETYAAIDALLASTLTVDDYVDLESLKVTAEHPPFNPGKAGEPTPPVRELALPDEPIYEEPPIPRGLAGAFGGKRRHAEAVAAAKSDHKRAMEAWQQECTNAQARHVDAVAKRDRQEADRLVKLAEAEATYRRQCAEREAQAATTNEELARFMNDLAFDVEAAIADYVGIVLSNSVYPDAFAVEHEYDFELSTRELTLRVDVPVPASVSSVKEYRYVKSKDEVTASQLSAKAQKDRYTSAVHQVAVRTLHEVFEADRSAKIQSIALTVGVNTVVPATGQPEYVPLVVVAADRETFDSFDLANVVPKATLEHLGAAVSKAPFDLAPADTSRGVRQRGQ